VAYTTPNFNLVCDVWIAGNNPGLGAADYTGVACQKYLYSRLSLDVHPCELELYVPPVQIRMPVEALIAWVEGQIFECPQGSENYYRAKFKEQLHEGFTNEYLVAYTVQCNTDGAPLLRNIEFAEPCEMPVEDIVGTGEPTIGADISEGDGGGFIAAP